MNILVTLLSFFLHFNYADSETIYVTAEKVDRTIERSTSVITVITEEEIIESQATTLTQLIETKAGVFVNSNGGVGKTSSVFTRGGDSSFTLVVIDGVEYSDRSSVGGAPLLEYLDLNNIKQIEILKGSQNVLYGSDALAGVIKITTKDPGIADNEYTLGIGSFNDHSLAANVQGPGKHFDYSLGFYFREMDGFSSFNENRTIHAEEDGYSNLTGQIKLSKKEGDHHFKFNLMGIAAKSEYDSASADVLDYIAKDDQSLISLSYGVDHNDYLSPIFKFSQNRANRLNNSSIGLSQLEAKMKKYEIENTSFFEQFDLIQGVEFEEVEASISSLDNRHIHKSIAAFLNAQKSWDKIDVQAGARLTDERDYDTQVVWKLGAVQQWTDSTFLKTNASTGFKTPSLYQLHSSVGNLELEPTESKSYDLGLLQKFWGHSLELVYFFNSFSNMIDYDSSVLKYTNTFKSETSGFEFDFRGSYQQWGYFFNGTKMKAVNLSSGKVGNYLPRRPRDKFSLGVNREFSSYQLGIDGHYVGQRENSDFDNIVLSSYFLTNFTARYRFGESSELNFILGNVLDRDYEQVNGYGTAGRNFHLKWRSKL